MTTDPNDGGLFSSPPSDAEPPVGETRNMQETEADTPTAPIEADTTDSTSTPNNSGNEVHLVMVDPRNRFQYGPNDEDVIEHEGKKLPRSEADKVLKLAEANSVTLIERNVE